MLDKSYRKLVTQCAQEGLDNSCWQRCYRSNPLEYVCLRDLNRVDCYCSLKLKEGNKELNRLWWSRSGSIVRI